MKKYQTSARKLSSKPLFRRVVIGIVATGLVVGSLAALDARNVIDLPFFKDKVAAPRSDGINYGPPTAEELQETEINKDSIAAQTDQQNSGATNSQVKKQVDLVLTSWGQNTSTQNVEVSGYVAGVVESGGVCTAVLELDGQKVTASQSANINAQSTSCGFITIERSKLSAGTWTIVLQYSSPSAEGNSSSVTQKVI